MALLEKIGPLVNLSRDLGQFPTHILHSLPTRSGILSFAFGEKTQWVDVKNGISLKDKIEVFGDLQEGDQLVLKANDELKEGQSVFQKVKNK